MPGRFCSVIFRSPKDLDRSKIMDLLTTTKACPSGNHQDNIRKTVAIISAVILVSITSLSNAQIASPISNISPVTSDRDGSDPNSASGGRVNGLAAHPTSTQKFFAASEWGGLFKSDDTGRTWTYVSEHVPQTTWDVEYNPSDGNMIVATSFYDGKTQPLSGISISRDGGRTWRVPPTSRPAAVDCSVAARAQEPAAFGIAFDPADTDDIYVGTNCGLAISNDNGVTWNIVDPTPGTNGSQRIYDVIVHNGGTIDICGDEGHFRSTNGGANFAAGAAEAGGMCSLAVSPDEANVIFRSTGLQIFESRDAGATWPTIFANPGAQGRIPFLKVNDRNGTAFDLWYGDTQLFRAGCTTPANTASNTARCPASNTWTNAQTGSHWDVGDLVFNISVSVDACPVLFSNDGGIYFNQRTGTNCHAPRWEQPTQSVTALWLWDMDGDTRLAKSEEGVYIAQQDSGGFGSQDAGKDAPSWKSANCCDFFDVEAEESRVVYTMCCWSPGPATRMYLDDKKMDGGSEISNYPPGTLVGFTDADSLSNYAPNRYAVVTSNGIYFTTNIAAGTPTWNVLGSNAPVGACGIYSSKNSSGTPVFVARVGGCGLGGSGSLWRLVGANSTAAWVRIERSGNSQFGALAVNSNNHNHIIVNDLSGATPMMVRTFDGGTTWQTLPQLNNMLTGNGDFVLQTQTGARPGDNAYPQASMVAINPHNPDMIVAGGQNSGVFISMDGGNSWRLITDPRTNFALRPHISRPLFAHFETFHGGHTNLYIGARGRGAWRIGINRDAYLSHSDFDGDGTDDIAIGSPWGIGTLEKSGNSFSAITLKPNGSRFDGWLLNTQDNQIEIIADLNGNNRSDMLFTSPWGVGVLYLQGANYRAHMLKPNGTRFGGWLLNTGDNKFGPVGNLKSNDREEFLVTSPWGIGVFELNGSNFNTLAMVPNGTRIGGWLLNTNDNHFELTGDFDGDGVDELFVTSPWGIGVIELNGSNFSGLALKPNGTRFNGWLLNTADNRFGPVGDFNNDGTDDILVRSPWGIGILNLSGGTFSGLMLKPNGTNFGGWVLNTAQDHSWGAGNFGTTSRDDVFVAGANGIAILKFNESAKTFEVTATGTNNTFYNGWRLSTTDNQFAGFRDLTGDNKADVLVYSPWGIGILSQNSSSFSAPAQGQNGVSYNGWRLNTKDNKFW